MPLYPDEPRPLAAVHANAALCFMKLAEEADGKQREVLYAQALKRAMSSAEADGTYAKAHDRCAKCFEALGEMEASNESRKLFEACKASDDAVKADEALEGGAGRAPGQGRRHRQTQGRDAADGRQTVEEAAAAAARLRKHGAEPGVDVHHFRWRRGDAGPGHLRRGAARAGWVGFGRARPLLVGAVDELFAVRGVVGVVHGLVGCVFLVRCRRRRVDRRSSVTSGPSSRSVASLLSRRVDAGLLPPA